MNTNISAAAAAATPSPRGCYLNLGGMGLTVDPQGRLDGLLGNEAADLILKEEVSGREIARWSPATTWTLQTIAHHLEGAANLIHDNLPVASYLGAAYLGSTEL